MVLSAIGVDISLMRSGATIPNQTAEDASGESHSPKLYSWPAGVGSLRVGESGGPRRRGVVGRLGEMRSRAKRLEGLLEAEKNHQSWHGLRF